VIKFELAKTEATIVGFHSTRHRGIFTPGDSNIHIHFQTPDNGKSGHIQKLEIGNGANPQPACGLRGCGKAGMRSFRGAGFDREPPDAVGPVRG
jgi:hypothetical protein